MSNAIKIYLLTALLFVFTFLSAKFVISELKSIPTKMTTTTIPVATVEKISLLIAISDNEVDSGTGFATASPASHPFAVRTKIGICY